MRRLEITCNRDPAIPVWDAYAEEYAGSRYWEKVGTFATEEAARALECKDEPGTFCEQSRCGYAGGAGRCERPQ